MKMADKKPMLYHLSNLMLLSGRLCSITMSPAMVMVMILVADMVGFLTVLVLLVDCYYYEDGGGDNEYTNTIVSSALFYSYITHFPSPSLSLTIPLL